jgi:hypothetical protein
MRRFRFTIASLVVAVLFAAVAFAALRQADDLWDSGVFTATLSLLGASVLVAVHRSGRSRAFWIGFALAGSAYLIASLIPPVGSRLLTTRALTFIDSKVPRAAQTRLALADFDGDGQIKLIFADASTPYADVSNAIARARGRGIFQDVTSSAETSAGGTILWKPALPWKLLLGTGGTSANFVGIGHSILALASAFLAGHLSRWLYAGRSGTGVEAEGEGVRRTS